jgi:hypothetical protein
MAACVSGEKNLGNLFLSMRRIDMPPKGNLSTISLKVF